MTVSSPARDIPPALQSTYRVLPLLIGCAIPASILINVQSITSPWVGIHTYNETLQDWNRDVEIVSIPHWLTVIVVLALVTAIICNICILFRFLERFVWHSVVLSLVTATLQDVLCIVAIVPFCILYPKSKGFIYLQGFWTMIASMIFSFVATALMSIDFHSTPNFRLQGSGVTHKQRILIAEAMSMCLYLAIGALIFIYIEKWTFLDALFFVVVTITTIGFGDKSPASPGGRVFVVFYAAGGIVLLALIVTSIRYVILEDLHGHFAIRAKEHRARRRAHRMERKAQRAREAEQLRRMEGSNTAEHVELHTFTRYFGHLPRHLHGAGTGSNRFKLHDIFSRTSDTSENWPAGRAEESHSDTTLNQMSRSEVLEMPKTTNDSQRATLQSASSTPMQSRNTSMRAEEASTEYGDVFHPQNTIDGDNSHNETTDDSRIKASHPNKSWWHRSTSIFRKKPTTAELVANMHLATIEELQEIERQQAYREMMQEYRIRLRISATTFIVFWLVGAVMFTFVESWDFGTSMYFVFIAFSTIGYGDLVPRTLAGRTIFLVYCLLGVVTLTSWASLVTEVLSKRMRKHIVERQLRREERLDEQDDGGGMTRNDTDLEAGLSQEAENDDLPRNDRVQVLHNLVETSPADETGIATDDVDCEGCLQKLVQVSKEFDQLLQKVLVQDESQIESNHTSHFPKELPQSPPPFSDPRAIVSYLEQEDDESDTFLGPSLSRDIISTSSMHQHLVHPIMHEGRHLTDSHSHTETYHGTNRASTPVNNSSQLNISAWPISATAALLGPSAVHITDVARERMPSPSLSLPAAMRSSPSPSYPTNHQHNGNDAIVVPAIQWRQLIDCATQFRALTEACEDALQKVAAWDAREKKLRKKRHENRLRQKKLLQKRRKQLEEQGLDLGGVDLDQEDELEDLEDWDEEGSNDDDDDETQDQIRGRIAERLLGRKKGEMRRGSGQDRLGDQRPSSARHHRRLEHQSQHPSDDRDDESDHNRSSTTQPTQPNRHHRQHRVRHTPLSPTPLPLSTLLQARIISQENMSSSPKPSFKSVHHAASHQHPRKDSSSIASASERRRQQPMDLRRHRRESYRNLPQSPSRRARADRYSLSATATRADLIDEQASSVTMQPSTQLRLSTMSAAAQTEPDTETSEHESASESRHIG
ncbi:hypothetical protein BGZ99_010036 [Dissophora globulifera]|uniref:Potassium channel domain-containing protein n=1 Tax=Dissophora globulifera TaxID=979702 RepID=A0A9P6RVY9_9FUNG|nr:hypothetical protein BGZ99_010036 [Dissophora globulifera]